MYSCVDVMNRHVNCHNKLENGIIYNILKTNITN